MAGDDPDRKHPSIPNWQQQFPFPSSNQSNQQSESNKPLEPAELDPLEQARRFLDDESIKHAPRERKVAFLETKGLKPEQIEDLLSPEQDQHESKAEQELKTVHDSTTTVESSTSPPQAQQVLFPTNTIFDANPTPRSEAPPIITYPEFLLNPQKPPPLVTLDRLATAAYILAGASALTYGASKYLVQPTLESLTDARHDLATTTQSSLTKLNTKLESSVSHVPYIPSLHKPNDADDTESIDSDPTELFHRDIATQTSPAVSRSSSFSTSPTPASSTDHQSARLQSLHSSLQSLLSSTTTHFSTDSLQTSLTDLQSVIDNLDSKSQPLDAAYASPYGWQTNSTKTTTKAGAGEKEKDSQATKFKADIRALKGAFLSNRNFPTTRAAAPFTLPTR